MYIYIYIYIIYQLCLEEKYQREIRIQTRVIALDEIIQSSTYDDDDIVHIPVSSTISSSPSLSSTRSGSSTPRHPADKKG
jgi:hypothetical protein